MFENKKNKHLFPTLDLHGETQKMATTLVNDFINDNLLLNNKYIVIVHGLGSGVLKETAYEVIKKNPNVLAYYVDPYNKGCTIVELTKNHNMNEAKEEKIEKVTKKIDGLQNVINELQISLFEEYKISNIEITNLFGLYNYSVNFEKSNIIVVHAPNGCGKSTFLKIIKKLLEFDFEELKKMPFAKIETTINGKKYAFDNMDNNYQLSNVLKHEDINTKHLLIDNLYNIDPSEFNNKIVYYLHSNTNSRNNRIKIFNEVMQKFFCYEKTVEIQVPMLRKIEEYGDYVVNSSDDMNCISDKIDSYLKIQYVGENSDVPNTFKNGELLKFENLSSGEQYVIKLFFKLIFELKDGSLIMLDEPEISLHVEWQELLIESIYEIANSMGIKVLIMTHSPYLLNYENIEVGNVEYEIEK